MQHENVLRLRCDEASNHGMCNAGAAWNLLETLAANGTRQDSREVPSRRGKRERARRGDIDFRESLCRRLLGSVFRYLARKKREDLFCCRAWPRGTHRLVESTQFRAATRKQRPCFAAECGLGRLGHALTPDGVEQPDERDVLVLLQNAAPTRVSTHEHSRVFGSGLQGVRVQNPPAQSVHFEICKRRPDFATVNSFRKMCVFARAGGRSRGGTLSQDVASTKSLGQSLLESHEKNGLVLLQNVALTAVGTQASGWSIGGTRKERRCFAAECGPTPLGTD